MAVGLVFLEVLGFCLANFAEKDSWAELGGFLLLQPVQIALNWIDASFQLTRGLRDIDAVLLVTLLSLPFNLLFWYSVWRGWRSVRRKLRRRRYALGGTHGPEASVRGSGSRSRGSSSTALPIDTEEAPASSGLRVSRSKATAQESVGLRK